MNSIENNLKKIIQSSGLNLFFRLIGLGASFLIILIISKLFSLENYGLYTLAFTITQATALVFALGIPNALIFLKGNRSLEVNESKALLFKGVKITALLSIIPFFFFFLFSNYLSEKIFLKPDLHQFLQITSITIPFLIIHELFLYHFISLGSFLKYNVFMFFLPNVFLILFLFLFYYFESSGFYTFLSFSVSIILVVLIEFIIIYESKLPKISDKVNSKQLFKVASPMLLSGLMIYLLNWTDVLMLGIMVDEKQVGIYNISYKLGTIGFLVIVSVSTFVTPRISELYGKGNLCELKELIHKSTRLIALLSIPIVLILILISDFLLSFFGVEDVSGKRALIIVAFGVLFSAMCGNVDQILNMTNNQKVLRNITVVCLILNISLNFILIPILGIEGAAIASLISNVFINLLCLYYIKQKLGFFTLF